MVANLASAGSSVEEISFEVDGRAFAGNQLSGKKLAEDLQADESAIEEMDDLLEEFDRTFPVG